MKCGGVAFPLRKHHSIDWARYDRQIYQSRTASIRRLVLYVTSSQPGHAKRVGAKKQATVRLPVLSHRLGALAHPASFPVLMMMTIGWG